MTQYVNIKDLRSKQFEDAMDLCISDKGISTYPKFTNAFYSEYLEKIDNDYELDIELESTFAQVLVGIYVNGITAIAENIETIVNNHHTQKTDTKIDHSFTSKKHLKEHKEEISHIVFDKVDKINSQIEIKIKKCASVFKTTLVLEKSISNTINNENKSWIRKLNEYSVLISATSVFIAAGVLLASILSTPEISIKEAEVNRLAQNPEQTLKNYIDPLNGKILEMEMSLKNKAEKDQVDKITPNFELIKQTNSRLSYFEDPSYNLIFLNNRISKKPDELKVEIKVSKVNNALFNLTITDLKTNTHKTESFIFGKWFKLQSKEWSFSGAAYETQPIGKSNLGSFKIYIKQDI